LSFAPISATTLLANLVQRSVFLPFLIVFRA
jgi:hypothetical protein